MPTATEEIRNWYRRTRMVHGNRRIANVTLSEEFYDTLNQEVGGSIMQLPDGGEILRGAPRAEGWRVVNYNLAPRQPPEPYTELVFDVDMS